METHLVRLLSRLVKINSINSTLSHGPGERQIAEYVLDYLGKLHLDAELQLTADNRTNVIAVVAGQARTGTLILNGHLDTVGVESMDDPFTLRREGDRLYGRGTYDMKGSLAVMLLLAEYFEQHPPDVDILLTFVADEEDKSTGMEHLVDKSLSNISPPAQGAIFLEPTEEDIGVSHKGFNWYELTVLGRAAHGSRPEEGIDAILPLRSALEELSSIQSELLKRDRDPLLGYATLHNSIIEGGTALSVIPSQSHLLWERRTLPGESQGDLQFELQRMMRAVENHPGNHEVKARELFNRPPYRVPDDARILKRLQKATPQSKRVGFSYWADSALAGMAGIPSVLFGPSGHGAHAVDEWVSLKSLLNVYKALKQLISDF